MLYDAYITEIEKLAESSRRDNRKAVPKEVAAKLASRYPSVRAGMVLRRSLEKKAARRDPDWDRELENKKFFKAMLGLAAYGAVTRGGPPLMRALRELAGVQPGKALTRGQAAALSLGRSLADAGVIYQAGAYVHDPRRGSGSQRGLVGTAQPADRGLGERREARPAPVPAPSLPRDPARGRDIGEEGPLVSLGGRPLGERAHDFGQEHDRYRFTGKKARDYRWKG